MEKKKYISNIAGECPVCGSHNLSWGDCENTGEYIYYDWECDDCHAEGREWYKLLFDGHSVLIEEMADNGERTFYYEDIDNYIPSEEV